MSATQISFVEFALTEQALCTPSVALPVAAVAAPCVAADGGECIQPHADYAGFDRLIALANETFCPPFADCWSRGGYVLAALANCVAPQSDSSRSQSERLASLRYMAAECIGAGC